MFDPIFVPKTFQEASQSVEAFLEERPSWKPFHTPKNLAMSLVLEASELMEHFQWCTPEQSFFPDAEKQKQIEQEIGDVLYLVFDLCNTLQIDPAVAFAEKLVLTGKKYPASEHYVLRGFLSLIEQRKALEAKKEDPKKNF